MVDRLAAMRLAVASTLAAAAAAAAALAACGNDARAAGRANVVLVVVDTLRADALTDPGQEVATPALDAFAAEGAVFLQAFSHAPMTLPSHTALFSSALSARERGPR